MFYSKMIRSLAKTVVPLKSSEYFKTLHLRCYHLTNLNVDTKTLNESYLKTKEKCECKIISLFFSFFYYYSPLLE